MDNKKFKTGVVIGKFLPPHLGHVALIEKSFEQCDKVYVVISDDIKKTESICSECSLPLMSAALRKKWLADHFTGSANAKSIKFLILDENNLKPFPSGAAEFAKRLTALVPSKIDALFYGEDSRVKGSKEHFPDTEMIVLERGIDTAPNIEGSKIRRNWYSFKDFMFKATIEFLNTFKLP